MLLMDFLNKVRFLKILFLIYKSIFKLCDTGNYNFVMEIQHVLSLITEILAFCLIGTSEILNRPMYFPTDVPGDGVRLREGPVDDKSPSASSTATACKGCCIGSNLW
jgi:hypothetical protein